MTDGGGIRIELEPFRSARLASNSVRIVAPERMVVVDAGGEPELLRLHLEAIRAAQPVPPVPVCFVQTHAHVDHVAGLTEYGPLPREWTYELAAHERGVRTLREADRSATLADLTGRALTPFAAEGWRTWEVRPRPGAGAAEPDLRIPLGGGAFLEAFCLPGHSPDGVAWRLGRELFAGDLLAATAPLVAGIAGWDRDALLASLDRFERIMAAADAERVHVGHGRPLDRAGATEALARSRREAGNLAAIEPVDVARVRGVAAHADGLIGELEELFGEMARRIARLADKLAQIQESRTADEVRGIDRSAEVGELLDAFGKFKREAHARGDGALGVAAKGVQTVQRIADLLAWERFDWVLEESFLRFVRTRTVDFVQRAKGLAPAADVAECDLGEWVRAFARRLRGQQIGACPLDLAEGGEAGLRRRLVYCLARAPSLGSAKLALSAAPGVLPARIDGARFSDALTRLIERFVAGGAENVALRAHMADGRGALDLVADGCGVRGGHVREEVWRSIFARAGAQASFGPGGAEGGVWFRWAESVSSVRRDCCGDGRA